MRPTVQPVPVEVEFVRICCGCGQHLGTTTQTMMNSEFVQMQLAAMGKIISHGLCEACAETAYNEAKEVIYGRAV